MSDYDEHQAAVRDALKREDVAAAVEILRSSLEIPQQAAVLRSLHSLVLERHMQRHAREQYRDSGTPEEREDALWLIMTMTRELQLLDPRELRAAVRAASARDDLTARDKMPMTYRALLRILPDEARDRLLRHCVELYEAAETQDRRDSLVALHAVASAGRPENTMSAERQRILRNTELVRYPKNFDLAWVELASGRDIPESIGAEMRRIYFDNHDDRSASQQNVVRLLADRLPVLNAGEQWSDRALAELAELPDTWAELVAHALTVPASQLSPAWKKKGRALLAEVDAQEFTERTLSWLVLIGGPSRLPRQTGGPCDMYNYVGARGLVHLVALLPERPEITRGLGTVLEISLRKMPGIGPGMPKLANACANALRGMDGEAALAELARLTTRVTYKSTLNLLRAGLNERAQAMGLGSEEIEELAVPSYGLTEVGRRVVHFGDATAELLVDNGRANPHWRNTAGKAVRSVPSPVRRDFPQELKELKAEVRDINTMLTAVTKRLERQFVTSREWPSPTWRERYLDHPLAGTIARRLLWTLNGTACRYSDGALRDLSGEPVRDEGTVRLWHPVGRTVEEVMAWREQLEDERVIQPFKQAHREAYLLTDAERRTGIYSNRFAGHILKQYQFRALAAERGWRDAELRMCHHDCAFPPAVRELPEWGLRAEYWVRGEGTIEDAPTTDSGAYELLAADQVRFYPIDAPTNMAGNMEGNGFSMSGPSEVAPLPLEEIPAQVFSEVLRDVDLFVGVTSVASDPTWQDGGPDGRYLEYWSSHGFGELSETARTRHDLLVRMLPRLAIGDRCHIEGRFLHVRGTLHTYKIHLGSGNILMTPGDRYLCIVPRNAPSSSSPHEYLPFDGDRMLSVILSKALMLADDTKITDPVILNQL